MVGEVGDKSERRCSIVPAGAVYSIPVRYEVTVGNAVMTTPLKRTVVVIM